MKSVDQDVVIPKNFSIGAPDAEADVALLFECFVDTGALEVLRDMENSASLVVGRTGHGKSALLLKLKQIEPRSHRLNLTEVAFKYVENSTVLKFFEQAGVNLGLFYKLLWRHVLVTELLSLKLDLGDQSALERWIESINAKLRPDSPRARAIQYLRKWGDRFWEDTEVRLKEVTKRIERELTVALEGTALAAKANVGGSDSLSEQERREVVTRGSAVVNAIQIRELSQLVEFMDDSIFTDPQKSYFLLIDALDEEWVSSSIRLKLIRALIEEIRALRKIKRVKIVCAVRRDLLEQVFDATRDGGFQEEKYESYYAYVTWTAEDLEKLVALRLAEVFRRKYTNRAIGIDDVFPKRRNSSPMEYMLERTFLRPRDMISFVNECLRVAANRGRISWQAMYDAEALYSRKRLSSLFDEWLAMFPSLPASVEVVKSMPESFTRSAITTEKLNDLAVQLSSLSKQDKLCDQFLSWYQDDKSKLTESDLAAAVLQQLYHVGIIGIKAGEQAPFVWSSRDRPTVTWGEIKRSIHIKVHKMFWKALDTKTPSAIRYKGVDGYDD